MKLRATTPITVSSSCSSFFRSGGFRRKGCELLLACVRPGTAYKWQFLLENHSIFLSPATSGPWDMVVALPGLYASSCGPGRPPNLQYVMMWEEHWHGHYHCITASRNPCTPESLSHLGMTYRVESRLGTHSFGVSSLYIIRVSYLHCV